MGRARLIKMASPAAVVVTEEAFDEVGCAVSVWFFCLPACRYSRSGKWAADFYDSACRRNRRRSLACRRIRQSRALRLELDLTVVLIKLAGLGACRNLPFAASPTKDDEGMGPWAILFGMQGKGVRLLHLGLPLVRRVAWTPSRAAARVCQRLPRSPPRPLPDCSRAPRPEGDPFIHLAADSTQSPFL